MESKFVASKFRANAAFEARLLLRPSHQRTVWTVNKLECPIPGRPTLPPILSSRSCSDSTSTPTPPFPESSSSTSTRTPPFPKSSSSTKDSQSSKLEDKNWFHSKAWLWVQGALAAGMATLGIGLIANATESIWKDLYQSFWRRVGESACESATYDQLKKGPVFQQTIKHTILRKPLVEKIRQLITPAEEGRLYPLIIGEHGTGKTSLIKLAVNGMDEPKGVVYVDIPLKCDLEVSVINKARNALGWSPDQVIDSKDPTSLEDVLQVLSRHAIKYKQEYGRVPVLIIDNANRLAQKQPRLLDLFQDYAKHAADNGIVTVVFMSSKGRVPRRMMERSSWSRKGRIIENSDISKEEALQYLKLRKIDEEQAAQVYELVGGRMAHLKWIADGIAENVTFEDMRQDIFSDTKSQLMSAETLPDRRYHKDGAKIVRELLKKGSISENAYYSLVGADTGDKLLETNIFAFHYNSREITFQSTVMKRYCEENSALWESQA